MESALSAEAKTLTHRTQAAQVGVKFSGTRMYTRQVIGLVSIFLLMGIAFVILSAVLSRHDADIISQAVNRDLAQQLLIENPLITDGQIDNDLVSESFDYLMRVNPSIEVYLIDLSGKILNFSADPAKVKRESVSMGPIRDFLAYPDKFPILGDDPRSPNKTKVFSVTPLLASGDMLGYLYVVLRGENVDLVQQVFNRSRVARSTALAVGLSMLAGLITSLLLFSFLGRRLTGLADRIAAFEDPSARHAHLKLNSFKKQPKDEIQLLESTFETMSSRIREQLHQLAETDDSRRALIARVSHDLRTPLSVLRTHLESLEMRYQKLSHDERLRHIDTANREIVHLNKLVNDLFDLSRLEASERSMKMEPVCLSDLVQDVIHKHELRAQQTKVGLMGDVDEFLWVKGDISSLERLLDNLVTNAIQYSPPNEMVYVGLKDSHNRLELVVDDRGPGIPAADRENVFEPFYRTVHSLKNGTGLGLSIARRVVELHNGTIQVGSSNDGTSLIVYLPRYQHTN